MTIHAVSTPLSTVIVAVLALAGIAAIIVWPIWRHAQRASAVAPPPSRTTSPLPAAGEIDGDYAARFHAHQECDVWPCSHDVERRQLTDGRVVVREHCRSGEPWPCEGSGLLNAPLPSSYFDEDARAFRRSWRETGRWDR